MTLIRRQFLELLGGLGATLSAMQNATSPAFAQAYPTRPIRIIGTTGPGGQGDTTARLVAAKLTDTVGQPFYVENMPGAGGNIAMAATARAAPDGYTVLCATSNLVTNISLYPKIPYDPYKDFEPVSLLCSSPHVLVVHPSVAAKSVNELVALAKADPGKLSYASAGRGTPAHLAGELFKFTFGVDITHVPFNGGGPGTAAALAGHVQMSVSALPTAITYIHAGNLRALALMGSRRSSALPDVPTMKEATGHDLPADIVNGFVFPTGTPKPIVEFLHAHVVKVMALPDVKEKLASMGFDPVAGTPEEFMAWIRSEIPRWAKVIRDANITIQ